MTPPADVIELLEPVRRLRAALAMAEFSSEHHVGRALEFAHPLITVRSVPGIAPGPGYVGHDGLRRYFVAAAKHDANALAVIHRAEVTEAGNVLAAGLLVSRTSTASASVSAWFVYRFMDGLISSVETYLDANTARTQARRRVESSDGSSGESPGSCGPPCR